MIARLAEHTHVPGDLDPAYVDRFRAWMEENVLSRTAADFAARVGHLRRAA